MARHNAVSLFGMVADDPIIVKDNEGIYKKGMMNLILIRNMRDVGDGDEALRYDKPIVYSGNPEMIEALSKLKKHDLVEIKGFLTTMDISKKTTCKHCGKTNLIRGTLAFISPVYLDIRKTESNERESLIELKNHMEISNQILLIGNLCDDVRYYHEGKIKTALYQLAVNRKYYLNDGYPNIRTDYPFVRCFGENASQARDAIYKGSVVLVDGRIQTREFSRESACEHCSETYDWNDNTIEVVPYSTEFLQNFHTQEEIDKKNEEELASIKSELFQ